MSGSSDSSSSEGLPCCPGRLDFTRLLLLGGGGYLLDSAFFVVFAITQHKLEKEPPGGLTKATASWSFSFFWLGWALATISILPAVDKVGRKLPYLALLSLGTAAAVAGSQAPSAAWFAPAVFLVGFFRSPGFQTGYLLMQESLPREMHTASIAALNVSYNLYGVLVAVLGGACFRELSWQREMLIYQVPYFAILLLGPCCLEESLSSSKAVMPSATLWKEPELRWRILFTLPCWMATVVGFYGIASSAGSLSPNFYINLALLSTTSVVGCGAAGLIVRWLGPKPAQTAAFVSAACCLLLCALLPPGWLRLAVAMAGRLALDVAFTTVYLLLLQCFPAGLRGTAIGVANFAGRTAGLCTPLFAIAPLSACCTGMAALCAVAAAATQALGVEEVEGTPDSCEEE